VSGRIAVLDSCALVPIRLATTLLWLAEAGLFQLLWSDPIRDEVERNLPKVGVTPEQASRRVGMMREAFGAEASVDDFGHLIDHMDCDQKDRHVLAAAVRGEANTIVTFNLADFPPESAAAHRVGVVHPDLFLVELLMEHPDAVIATLERETAAFRNPGQSVLQFLATLTSTVPVFANHAADALTDT
jgi:predicted nucleic acid-binding protein